MVTTTTGASATWMPYRMAYAGPRPKSLITTRTDGALSAYSSMTGIVESSGMSTTTRTSHGRFTDSRSRSSTGTMLVDSL